ncbi:CAP domain-containing protein [Halosegnis longus]|uniref:CAP domain-containing protein n=1 Tax=Halosegnis longus TaxID=2216012 RepID=UPI00129EBB5A|nr:CAP domain-containing protein [Halosegnis longus]
MNKNLLPVTVVVLAVVVIGVGATQFGGQATAPSTPTPESPTPTPTATPTATPTPTGDGTATPTPTVTPTPTPTPAPTVETARIERAVEQDIRAFQDDPTTVGNEAMNTGGQIPAALSAMAERHSEQMATAGRLAHTIDGSTTADRYAQNGTIANCRVVNNQEQYVVAKETMEGFVRVPRVGDDPATVGQRLVDHLLSDDQARRTLELENADHIGVGVATSDEFVYVTVAVC